MYKAYIVYFQAIVGTASHLKKYVVESVETLFCALSSEVNLVISLVLEYIYMSIAILPFLKYMTKKYKVNRFF